MNLVGAAERLPLPDAIARAGVAALVGRARRRLDLADLNADRDFAFSMAAQPIAMHPDRANAQHYELPPEFFAHVLGPRRKYSCCLYAPGVTDLAAAEERALAETAEHAGVADGQDILELGCGWGSLTLWMAERLPNARITAVSNSASQRAYVLAEAARRHRGDVTVVTADMNGFAPAGRFDRIVSVEMFEHMANWRSLLGRMRGWLNPSGRAFLHVFTHRRAPYRFDHTDRADWIAQHFFTGGIMPSQGLIRQFADLFAVEAQWRWSGRHYARTAQGWLANFDANRQEVDRLLRAAYGADAALWRRRWRLFFMATAGLFGHQEGAEWGVSHYLLRPD